MGGGPEIANSRLCLGRAKSADRVGGGRTVIFHGSSGNRGPFLSNYTVRFLGPNLGKGSYTASR